MPNTTTDRVHCTVVHNEDRPCTITITHSYRVDPPVVPATPTAKDLRPGDRIYLSRLAGDRGWAHATYPSEHVGTVREIRYEDSPQSRSGYRQRLLVTVDRNGARSRDVLFLAAGTPVVLA